MPRSNNEASALENLGGIFAATALFIGAMFLHAAVFRDICCWFMVPLSMSFDMPVAPPTYGQAFAMVALFLSFLSLFKLRNQERNTGPLTSRFAVLFENSVFLPAILWCLLWLVSLFVPLLL